MSIEAFSTYSGNLILTWLFTASAATRPTAWWVELHTGDPGDDGSANEVTTSIDVDYVRKAFVGGTAALKRMASTAACSWTTGAGATPHTVTHVSIWDAEIAGNCLFKAEKAVPVARTAGSVMTFEIGEIITGVR